MRKRNLKVSGKKKDLVERLLFHDRNSTKLEPEPEFKLILPETSMYKDIHQDHLVTFPTVTESRMEDFLSTCDQKIDEKIQMLYEQRYLRCVRSVMKDQRTFVTSVVWAEMKKSTCYNVDIILDVNGVVLQTQCESAVGQGPSAHYKHVQCVLFGLTRNCNNGSILSEVTCTQVLSTVSQKQTTERKPAEGQQLKPFERKTKATSI